MSEIMIQTHGLARNFKTRQGIVEAVRGVDFTVNAGEIIGFLGPNGAGKTTTLRMLTTLLTPTAGTATVAGCDLAADPHGVRRRIGYVSQGGGADAACKVREELILQARLYRIDLSQARRRADDLCNQLDLGGLEDRLIQTLSGGQRRRLDVVMGLVHSPPLLFLDEPTTGLDPHSRSNMWDHIRRLRDREKTTVFLTTHYLEEADNLADRILIIDHGKIVAEGTPEKLKREVAGDVVTIEVSADAQKAKEILANQADVREIVLTDQTLRLTVEHGKQTLITLMRALDSAGVPLASIQLSRPTLDDVFLKMTGRSLREEEAKESGR